MAAKHIYSDEEIAAAHRFIAQIAGIYGRGLSQDDCISEGWIGYLYAKSVYLRHAGVYQFGEYAFLCIARRISRIKRIRNAVWRMESRISADDAARAFVLQRRAEADFAREVYFKASVEALPPLERVIASDYITGCTDDEIMRQRKLSRRRLSSIRESIRDIISDAV